jgi:hypothetical protein
MRIRNVFGRSAVSGWRRQIPVSTTSDVASALARADALAIDGRTVDAVDRLAAVAGVGLDPALVTRLLELRYEAACSMDPGPGRSPWPPAYQDPFPAVAGRVPEVDISALSADIMGGAVAHHGCLLVRGILDAGQVEAVVAGMHRAERRRDATDDDFDDNSWYRPFAGPRGAPERARVAREGGIWLADSPANAALVLDLLSSAGVVAAVAEHLGERPFFSLQKSTLRHSLPINNFTGWHQDGSFLGPEIRTMNVWTALSRCGGDRPTPGLEIVPKRVPEILSTEGGLGPISVAPALVDKVSADAPPVRPEFEPGDGLLFDERFLHRTYLHENMTEDRYAVECWLFAPSHASAEYLSFLI